MDRLTIAHEKILILYEEQKEKLKQNDESLKIVQQQIRDLENADE